MAAALVVRTGIASAEQMAAWSSLGLDAPLLGDAELWVAQATTQAELLGAFERAPSRTEAAFVRRGSGGPTVRVGPQTIHVALRLQRPGALTPCEPSKIVNRYVRPLLRALTRLGATAHYFGRDWVSVEHRPAAWVGFAHDSASGRATFEAFVAMSVPFAAGQRASFLGKEPLALADLAGPPIAPSRVSPAIVDAYARAYDRLPEVVPLPACESEAASRPLRLRSPGPPWRASIEEAIGPVSAGLDETGTFRLGGALLASRDAVAECEARAPSIGPDERALGAMVLEVFGRTGVALHGVRSMDSIRDVLRRALEPAP